MIDPNTLDQLTRRITEAMPESMRSLQHDVEHNVKAILQSLFQQMDLVSRDEFDVQTALLQRCREKINELEERVKQLESQSPDK